MNGDDFPEEYKFMIRRKFYVPIKESKRDYGRHERLSSDIVLPCDFEETKEDNDEDTIQWEESKPY